MAKTTSWEPHTHFGRALKELADAKQLRQADIARAVEPFDATLDQFQVSKYFSSNPKTAFVPQAKRVAAIAAAFPDWAARLWHAWRRDEVGHVADAELAFHSGALPIYERLFSLEAPPVTSDPDQLVAAAKQASVALSPSDARAVANALELLASRPELARSLAAFMLVSAGKVPLESPAPAPPTPPATSASG